MAQVTYWLPGFIKEEIDEIVKKNALLAPALAIALSAGNAAANDLEVLHWWTSGGEAAALNVLKQDLEGQGIGWQDMPLPAVGANKP